MMDRDFTVFVMSEVKNSLKWEPLHQALSQERNKNQNSFTPRIFKTSNREMLPEAFWAMLWMWRVKFVILLSMFNPLNTELNPICHLLALLGGATIVVVSRLKVNALSFFSLLQSVSLYCPLKRNVHAPSQNVLPWEMKNLTGRQNLRYSPKSDIKTA